MKVLLDTNALMAVAEFKIDLFGELVGNSLFVLSGTLEELEKIKIEQRGKYKRAANLALALIKGRVKIMKSSGPVDDFLVSKSSSYVVLTQDVKLKKKLNKPYMTIRQKKKVVLVK